MTFFGIMALLLALLVAAVVVWPLWRQAPLPEESLLALNRRVFRERLAELENDAAQGLLDAATLAELRTELERNLLQLDVPAPSPSPSARGWRLAALLLLVLMPCAALLFYGGVLAPRSLEAWWELRQDMGPSVDKLLQGEMPKANDNPGRTLADFIRVLQDRLQKQPDNAEGWFMLGMSYVQSELPEPALVAFEHAWRQAPGELRYTLAYAQTRLFSNEGQLDAQTRQLLEAVLAQYPDHEGALVLLGMGAFRSGDYAAAITALEHLRQLRQQRHAASSPALTQQLDATLQEARSRLQAAQPGAQAGAVIRVSVAVDRSLQGAYQPDDVVYVFARALKGAPMPVAVVRRPAAQLPFSVELDDRSSVMPGQKLSDVGEVVVSARISRHGGPEARAGDLEAVAVPLRRQAQAQDVRLLIQSVRP